MIASPETEPEKEKLTRDKHELSEAEASILESTERLFDAEKKLEAAIGRDRDLEEQLEKLKAEETNATQLLERESKATEKLLSKRSVMLLKRDDCVRKIRDLGSLPAEVFDESNKMKELSIKQLMAKLEKVSKKIKKIQSC